MLKWTDTKTACLRFALRFVYVAFKEIYYLKARIHFIFNRPYHLILNTRLPNYTKVTDCTIYGPRYYNLHFFFPWKTGKGQTNTARGFDSFINLWRFLFLSGEEKNNNKNQTKNKRNRRKCLEMPFRPSQRDHSSRVCCSHQSHFGIRVALCASTNLLLPTSTFFTCFIQYLPLYKRKRV